MGKIESLANEARRLGKLDVPLLELTVLVDGLDGRPAWPKIQAAFLQHGISASIDHWPASHANTIVTLRPPLAQ